MDAASSRIRTYLICKNPSHFCYQCPECKLECLYICGDDYFRLECPFLEEKFVKEQKTAYGNVDLMDNVNLNLKTMSVIKLLS